MSYVVNWRGSDGQAGWHPVGDLPEAAAHVEHLRNVEGVTETKIFKLDEVAFEFRQYFRVELAPEDATAPTFALPATDPAPAPVPEVVTWTTAEVEAPEPEVAEVAEVEPVHAHEAHEVHEVHEAVVPDFVPEPVLAEVGDTSPSNGQRRGLFGR